MRQHQRLVAITTLLLAFSAPACSQGGFESVARQAVDELAHVAWWLPWRRRDRLLHHHYMSVRWACEAVPDGHDWAGVYDAGRALIHLAPDGRFMATANGCGTCWPFFGHGVLEHAQGGLVFDTLDVEWYFGGEASPCPPSTWRLVRWRSFRYLVHVGPWSLACVDGEAAGPLDADDGCIVVPRRDAPWPGTLSDTEREHVMDRLVRACST